MILAQAKHFISRASNSTRKLLHGRLRHQALSFKARVRFRAPSRV